MYSCHFRQAIYGKSVCFALLPLVFDRLREDRVAPSRCAYDLPSHSFDDGAVN